MGCGLVWINPDSGLILWRIIISIKMMRIPLCGIFVPDHLEYSCLLHVLYCCWGVPFFECPYLWYVALLIIRLRLVNSFSGILMSCYLLLPILNPLMLVIIYPCCSVRKFSPWFVVLFLCYCLFYCYFCFMNISFTSF